MFKLELISLYKINPMDMRLRIIIIVFVVVVIFYFFQLILGYMNKKEHFTSHYFDDVEKYENAPNVSQEKPVESTKPYELRIFLLDEIEKLNISDKSIKGNIMEKTFSIIKPDATRRNLTGKVITKLEEAGLRIVAQKRVHLTKEQAGGFYAVHKERPFYNDLVAFMTSGPVVLQVLEGENAVAKNREVMGATNPANADAGTIRADLAESIEANTVHGSDSIENAAIEIAYFFKPEEIVG
jgi:nucleoside-diphosphate kinase